MSARIPAHVREQQINSLPNIRFVRWADEYRNKTSKAVCRCITGRHEWAASVHNLVNGGYGCPKCAGNRRWGPEERIAQINAIKNITFVRWCGEYKNLNSKARYRCSVDGFEWATTLSCLLQQGGGCPQCAGMRRWTAEERIAQINSIVNVSFVRWVDGYRNCYSKAVCRCSVDGFEWAAQVHSLVNVQTGCPRCSKTGFNPALPATLYILRSECGAMVKIGISNNYAQRHRQLARVTPFSWDCIELIHGDGTSVASAEKGLHDLTERVEFVEKFDGHTEWRRWDSRLPLWLEHYRRHIEAL